MAGLHDFGQLHAAELFQRETEAVDVAGHGDGPRAVHVAVVLDRGPGEQIAGETRRQRIVGGIECARRDRAEIDHLDAVSFARYTSMKPTPPRPLFTARPRRAQSRSRPRHPRRCRAGEYARPGFPGNAVLRGDDAAARARNGLADSPVLGEMFEHDNGLGLRCAEDANRNHSRVRRARRDAMRFRVLTCGCGHRIMTLE